VGKKKKTAAHSPVGAPVAALSGIPFEERFAWQAAALLLLVLLAYANSLGASFHFDDYAILLDGYITNPGFGWEILRPAQTRPLTYLTFHWNYLLGGPDPEGYHWLNLILHAANCVLLLAIARKYLSAWVAGCIAVVFALHPLQTEAVTYVFARSTLLSTHFALWSLWFYARDRWAWSAALFGVSLLAKEETVAMPALFLLLDLWQRKRPRLGFYALLGGFAAAAAGRLFYLIYTAPVDPGVGRVRGISTLAYLLTQGRVLWNYLRLTLLPVGLNLDRDVAVSQSLFSPWTTVVAWLGLAALGGVLLWFAWKGWSNGADAPGADVPGATAWKSAAAFWALGYFVLISPSSSIVAQADLMFEHRTYLPMVCLVIALGFLLERVPKASLTVALCVLTPVMLIATVERNSDWHDEKSFWSDIMVKSPHKSRAYLGLARALMTEDPTRSRELLRQGLEIDPNNAELQTNYGVALMGASQPAEAMVHFQRAMALTRETADTWNNIGAAHYSLKEYDDSLKSYERALQLDPCSYNARRNVVMLYGTSDRPDDAWRSGEIPATCHMVPDQVRELEKFRRQMGKR
jgi:protein O-mannosyl-transferase